MSCPTCGFQLLDMSVEKFDPPGRNIRMWHCARCGTLLHTADEEPDKIIGITVPSLVERCRTFQHEVIGPMGNELIEGTDTLADEWKRIGISKAINKPEDRP